MAGPVGGSGASAMIWALYSARPMPDVDPGALQFIMHKENMDIDQMLNVLNKKSGVYGMSGVSSDFRDVENAANDGLDCDYLLYSRLYL